ncbi:MAG TPA: formate/nitrite transporter family protein [Acidimicrobiales bacterium]|nr:formate/nitrite transporter family protein [Acidimicrobiales bacterium]
MTAELTSTFQSSVDAGTARLERHWPGLLATGTVGGIDVGLGVFGLFVVQHATGNGMLGSLAFTIGFIALALANSELFTENFLVPVAAVAARRSTPLALLRLWTGTAVMNLVGGWVLMGVIMASSPELRATAVEIGNHHIEVGIGFRSFASAVLGGTIITLMTWMERGTDSMPAKLVAAVAAGFLLAAGKLHHVIVISLEAFAGLQAGAPFGYADWLGMAGWAALGNAVGGLGLVTMLRLVQVGKDVLDEERRRPESQTRGEGNQRSSERGKEAAEAEATPR